MRREWSLRRRLAFGLMLAALLPVLLFSGVMLSNQWSREHDGLLLRLEANARLSASIIDAFLDAQLAGVRLLAERPMEAGPDGAELAQLLAIYPTMLRALHANAEGDVVTARDTRGRSLAPLKKLVRGDDWFVAARDAHRPYVSDAFRRTAYGNEIVVAVSAPLLEDGRFDGTVSAALPVESLARLNASGLSRLRMELLLLDRSNRVIYAGPGVNLAPLSPAGRNGDIIRGQAAAVDRQAEALKLSGLLRDGDTAYVHAVAMNNGWTLALLAPGRLLLEPLLPHLLLLAPLVLVSLLGVYLAVRKQRLLLERSIGGLLVSVQGYALGGTMDAARMKGMPQELHPLSEGIGELAMRLNHTYGELQQVLDERDQVIAAKTESLREAVAELDRLSRTDALTGALNYRGFLETGECLWQAAERHDKPLSVLMLDIDHFKRYNDHYGHAEGDGVLRRFVGAVRSALQHVDDVLARPGGEEFAVFLPGSTHEQALNVARRVCQRVRDADIEHVAVDGGRLTVSIGVATRQGNEGSLEALLLQADEALYRAKAGGRDRVSE